MRICSRCQKALPDNLVVQRSTVCPFCGADLKTCLNCKFYSPQAHWQCLETIADPVRDKEKSNFCEFFCFSEQMKGLNLKTNKKKAREDFNKLFGAS